MKQLDLFSSEDRQVWDELNSIQKSIRGLFARFNYLEREWIDLQRVKSEEKEREILEKHVS